ENAMAVELRSRRIAFRTQAPLKVTYRGEPVGEYFADMIVENTVICEFKALETVPRAAEIQLVNDLVATGIDSGLLVNFGHSVTVRRKFRTHKK
ncbi:MAG: GxxExxY protein, partial [Candidatus Thiosymbion ectosymbiont of Robbea hypermnestra]|nr:GxxExxY protein [Candidatus Thiosymbion ectosymbiont of Robbea hypermnestra]